MPALLLKTDEKHVEGVRRNAKHATEACPRELVEGDLILIQVTYKASGVSVCRVRYVMEFVECYEDKYGESERIWGRHWHHIIEGRNFHQLRRPFDIDELQVSTKNYGRGVIKYAYIRDEDMKRIIALGHLEPA